jgi:hypothetical protein
MKFIICRCVVIVAQMLPQNSYAVASVEKTVPIKLAPASNCWKYEGRGTTFVGEFHEGQKVTATAAGEIFYAVPGHQLT